MTTDATCPPADELRQLLDGTLSGERQKACTDHMGTCHCCQTRLEVLATEGSNLSSLVHSLHESEPPANSGYWKAASLLNAAIDETFIPLAQRRPDVTLDFLQPATDSAYLGRLAQFDVMRVIGRGGMGLVLEAFDSRLQRNVALKVLDPGLVGDEVSRQRFCREARAAASVTHENVVAVHQVERSGEEGLPYLVMQLIGGESLEQRLQRQKKLPTREIVRIAMQIANGLAAAYAQGLIHRDIKPGNILLEESHDNVKLTDFGLARLVDDVKLTRTGFVTGTPLYMSPEQAMGEEADHRSDLFSLGAIMYEMATGQPPFAGNSALMILKQIADAKHRPLRELNPETPEWLAETIDRLLSKKPDERIQSATQLAELLEFQLALMKTGEDVPQVCRIEEEKQAKRNRRIGAAISVVFLLLGLAGGLFLANRKNASRSEPAVAPVVAMVPPLAVLSANAGTVWSANFDPTNKTVAMAVEDGSVRLWDLPSQSVKATINAHRGVVWSAQFAKNGEWLVTAGDDGTIKIWQTSQPNEPLKTFHNSNAVRGLALLADNKSFVAGDRMGDIRVWSIDTEQPLHETQQPSAVYAIAVTPDYQTLATGGNDKIIRLWDAKSLTQKITLEGHAGPIYGLSFSNDGRRLASAGWDKQVRIWDANSGLLLKSWDGQGADIWGVTFSPDGKQLATGSHDGMLRLWDAESGELKEAFHGHKTAIHSASFSPDGTLVASGGRDGSIKVWKVGSGASGASK